MQKSKSGVSKKKDNGKRNTGRPSKYDPKYCKEIVDYFERCQAEIMVDVKFFQPNKNATISTILNPLNQDETLEAGNVKEITQKLVMTRFPTLIRYSRLLGINESTIHQRAKDYKDFSKSLEECKKIQEAILLENGLQGTFNPQFAMFLLKNNHGYKDKSEVDTNHSGTIELKKISVDITNEGF